MPQSRFAGFETPAFGAQLTGWTTLPDHIRRVAIFYAPPSTKGEAPRIVSFPVTHLAHVMTSVSDDDTDNTGGDLLDSDNTPETMSHIDFIYLHPLGAGLVSEGYLSPDDVDMAFYEMVTEPIDWPAVVFGVTLFLQAQGEDPSLASETMPEIDEEAAEELGADDFEDEEDV